MFFEFTSNLYFTRADYLYFRQGFLDNSLLRPILAKS